MPIVSQRRGNLTTREVRLDATEDVQICRLYDDEDSAHTNQIMFAQASNQVEDSSWVGKRMDDLIGEFAAEPVVLRFGYPGAVLRLIDDLMVVYNNLIEVDTND